MDPNADQPKSPETKPDAKFDLKSLPLPELRAKSGASPDGLSQAEARKRLTQYGPNEIEEKKPVEQVSKIQKIINFVIGN